MTKETTLFARYKRMINLMWEDGQRKYTARELNTFVGDYETKTAWKRWNNNPYYTTRTYQAALKHLGCITKIKRGLWQINGPIPEWFGSFHINALSNKSALATLEKSSLYWQQLPDEHKVNPWKNNNITNTMKTDTMKTESYYVTTTINGVMIVNLLPMLTMQAVIGVDVSDGITTGECVDHTYQINGVDIGPATACEMLLAVLGTNGAVTNAINAAKDVATKFAVDEYIAKAQVKQDTKEVLYTEAEVRYILQQFASSIVDEVSETVESNLENVDGEDAVDLSFDNWDRRIEASLDVSKITDTVTHGIREACQTAADNYEIEKPTRG